MPMVYQFDEKNSELEGMMKRASEIPNVAEILSIVSHSNKISAIVSASAASSSSSPRLGNVYYASTTKAL